MKESYSSRLPLTEEILSPARTLWEYHHVHHELQQCDCILALGSHDLRVANRAADLWLQGWAPYIVFSGGLGNLTLGMWQESEADKFATIAISMGVPKEKILIENRSTNTGENILFTKQLLAANSLSPQKLLLVQKPYMERRTYATVKKLWPEKDIIVTSPQFTFENYAIESIPIEKVIHIMVGDFQRIKVYPSKGFQIHQDIPAEAEQAYKKLIALGFTDHMIQEPTGVNQ